MARPIYCALACAAVLALLNTGCALFAPHFSIVEWRPSESRIVDPSGISLWIRFSGTADKISAQQAFSLTKDGGAIYGEFSWVGDVMRFVPAEGFEKNRKYAAVLSTSAEDDAGVSLDEEATNMLQFQHAYQAAARVITTMDEMLNTLINGTGLVGRG